MKSALRCLCFTVVVLLGACGGGGGGGGSATKSSSAPAGNQNQISGAETATSSSASVSSVPSGEQTGGENQSGEPLENAESFAFLKGTVVSQTVYTSAITGIDYPVHIYLPEGYHHSERDYPIVYALDGQVLFPGLPYLLEDEGVEAILVSIAEGPDDRRRTDYLLPGARDYFQFLVNELIPFAESGLRVNASQRTLVGTSFGGVFAGLALLMDDSVNPLFHNFLAFDGSFYQHPEQTEMLEQSRYLASGELNARVFLSSALPEGNDEYVSSFAASLSQRNFSGLTIEHDQFQTTHGKITEPSFRTAIRELWGESGNE